MFHIGAAVDDGQVAAAYNLKHAAIGSRVSIPQHIAVQIYRGLAVTAACPEMVTSSASVYTPLPRPLAT